MAWETRNGRGSYYTRSKRVDGKVIREYIGTGPTASIIAEIDALDRKERHQDQVKIKVEKEAQRIIDQRLDEEFRFIKTITKALLMVNGYHNHKGQWRKKRNG